MDICRKHFTHRPPVKNPFCFVFYSFDAWTLENLQGHALVTNWCQKCRWTILETLNFSAGRRIVAPSYRRPLRLTFSWEFFPDAVHLSNDKIIGGFFRVTSPFPEFAGKFGLSGDRCVTKLPAETGKGLSGLEMPPIIFCLYKKIIGGCFGVTSPFREFASNLGDQIARGDRERPERPGNASNNVF